MGEGLAVVRRWRGAKARSGGDRSPSAQGLKKSSEENLSARNDALANIAIVAAGLVTIVTLSAWPDLLVGLGIFFMNLDVAREVYTTARRERSLAVGQP